MGYFLIQASQLLTDFLLFFDIGEEKKGDNTKYIFKFGLLVKQHKQIDDMSLKFITPYGHFHHFLTLYRPNNEK